MTTEQKIAKVLAMAATHGVPAGYMPSTVALVRNQLDTQICISATGNTSLRLFLKKAD